MLTLFTGRFSDLLPAQQEAIHQLTVCRYVEDIYHLQAHVQQFEGLKPHTPEFEEMYANYLEQIKQALTHFDERTYLAAILVSDESNHCYALAAMRILKGKIDDAVVSRTIGCDYSSLPTHQLLVGFQYPKLPDFDPDVVTEIKISEVSRLVSADKEQFEKVVALGLLSQEALRSLMTSAMSEMIVSFYRTGNPGIQVNGLIFNVKPKLAAILKLRKGINLVPLFMEGTEPTALALSAMPDRLYFDQWQANLSKLVPKTQKIQGTRAALRDLVGRDYHEWIGCECSLPYLLVNNSEFEGTIDNLESDLGHQRRYEFSERLNYG